MKKRIVVAAHFCGCEEYADGGKFLCGRGENCSQKQAPAPLFTPEDADTIRAAISYLDPPARDGLVGRDLERIAQKMSAPSEKP